MPPVSTRIGVGPAAEKPVPLNVMTCGLSGAVSVTVRVAVRLPVAVGLKTAVSVHEPPAGTVMPTHWSSVMLKSSGSTPPCRSPLMNSGDPPVLVSVIVCGALVVPTSCVA